MKKTALYRHYDSEGVLLYVGITNCLSERDKQHAATAHWHGDVVDTATKWFSCRDDALSAERAAIIDEDPMHNIQRTSREVAERPYDGWRGRLFEAIEKSGKSMRSVSQAAGCSNGYIHGVLMDGKDPTLERFMAICAAVPVDPAAVYTGAPA